MPASLPSRRFLAVVTSLAVVLAAWYGVRTASRDSALPVPLPRPVLPAPGEGAEARPPAHGKHDGGGEELAALREAIHRLRNDLATVRQQGALHTAQLSALRRQVQGHAAHLETPRAAVKRIPAPAADPASPAPADAVAQDAALLEEEDERSQQRAQANAQAFTLQAVDAAWADEAESLLQEALASGPLHDTQLSDLHCRTTLCRLEVTHETPAQRAQFEQALPFLVTPLLPRIAMHTTEADDGASTTVVYLAREGTALPQEQ